MEPWIEVPRDKIKKSGVVVSITKNWRSFPDSYWRILLQGIDDFTFVGTKKEWDAIRLERGTFVQTADALELAAIIAGATLFLGTVSFPYALAEALKVPRFVELCHRNLNAFPMGPQGHVLPIDVFQARKKIDEVLEAPPQKYREVSAKLKRRPNIQILRWANLLGINFRKSVATAGIVVRRSVGKVLKGLLG